MESHNELPSLRGTIRPELPVSSPEVDWFDVKFYPYTQPGEDAVFAVVGGPYTLICRCVPKQDSTIEILGTFKDPDDNLLLNSVAWSQAENGDPLVCVSGNGSKIKVLNVAKDGELVATLVGHGDIINDLAISPLDPTILASASKDHTVRIWSLDPTHARSPSAAIMFGQAHTDQLLSIAYHRKGGYILSAGMDTRVNLWKVPDKLKERMGTDTPARVHYAHFSTSEIHTDYVDCVRFYNDIILSGASRENTIQMWRIDGFDPDRPPPALAPVPLSQTSTSTSHVTVATSSLSGTRSAWGGRFQRLLQFDFPDHDIFYMRFQVFHQMGKHPLLIAGTMKSKILIWDLQRLETAGSGTEPSTPPQNAPPTQAPKSRLAHSVREESSTSTSAPSEHAKAAKSGRAPAARYQYIGDPFRAIKAHEEIIVPDKLPGNRFFNFWQFDFSKDGRWCVGGGSRGMISVLCRWAEGVPSSETGLGAS